MKWLAVVLALVFGSGAVLGESPMQQAQTIHEECRSQHNTRDAVSECLIKWNQAYGREMSHTFDLLYKRSEGKANELLVNSQKAWDSYLKNTCLLQAMVVYGDDIEKGKEELVRCILYITLIRLGFLQYVMNPTASN